ncbi:MAG: hypothetical protein A2X18_08075 [Bacteroidetes bacterium GWF2_40_14]|nr:MAG: hypothetical protein A2X18_08075 [Bacteroidetes bacterium GWF2_40_14]
MAINFPSEFQKFLDFHKIDYSVNGSVFTICKPEISIRVISVGESAPDNRGSQNITLYEDEWVTKYQLVTNRLLANLGRQKSVFARNCVVKPISAESAREFLEKNHILGYTACSYKYALYIRKATEDINENEIVAVAMFSAPRPMVREGKKILSYEWVRYAGLAEYRIAGGMGKLLKYFIDKYSPDEIMSYADKDWSDGNVYRKLGFKYSCDTEPIDFYVDRTSMERIPAKKILRDKQYDPQDLYKKYFLLRNQGNLKFYWRAAFVS